MKLFKTAGLIFSIVSLASCGGGGGGSKKPQERPAGSVLGVAHDGPIQNGDISAFTYTHEGKGAFLVSGLTNDVGDYSLSIQSDDTPVYLEVTSGAYEEEASGRRVTLSGGQKLTAVTFYESGMPVDLQLTQYTTWAQCYSDYLISKGATVGNAIVNATETFGNLAGVPIVATRPIDITDERNFSAFLTPGLRYGYLLAGISGLTQDLAALNNVPAHSSEQYTSIYFTGVVCADIKHDGLMNGIGAPTEGNPSGQLYIGNVALNQEHYRTMIGQNILEVAANTEINKAGIKPAELLNFANNISLNGHNIFAGVEPRAVDIEGPIITPSVANGSLVSGVTEIDVSAVDPLGVATVAFYLDDTFLQNGVIEDLSTTIITQNFPDGEHVLKIVATDILNNESIYELPLTFVNTGANLTITSPTLTNLPNYVVSGTYAKGAAPVDRIVVQGVEAELNADNSTWSATIQLSAGVNNVEATIYDEFDNAATATAMISLDLIHPTIFDENTIARFTTYEGFYNRCFYGDFNDSSAENTPVCLDATKIQLNGKPVSRSLTNEDYLVLGVRLNDPLGSGVFTDIQDLVIEYMYERESGLVVDWTPAPRQTKSSSNGVVISDEVYLPLVTEYLGADFFITDNDEKHTVTFRVTDKAGNSTIIPFVFKLDVLTPQLAVSNAKVKNESLFDTAFNLRTGLNGANAEVAYEVTNDTSVPYLVSFDAPAQHNLLHTWNGAIRKNRARIVEQEEWRVKWTKTGNASVGLSWSDWVEVTQIYVDKRSPFGGVIVRGIVNRPAPVAGAYSNILTEQMTAPLPSSWLPYDYLDCKPPLSNDDGSVKQYRHATDTTLFACYYDYVDGGESGYVLKGNEYFNTRTSYSVQYEATYPKNLISTQTQNYSFFGNNIRLFNKTTNTEIFPVGGWFKIPASSTVEVVNQIKLPSIINYIDSRVSANDSTVPYVGEIFLDKSLAYTLNTSMTMKHAIDPNDFSKINDVSITTDVIGGSPIVEAVSR